MIKAFALDIDGVFTDGSILCTTDGDLLRVYDAKDGFAIRMAVMNGYPVGIITGGSSESIRKRMLASGILPGDVYLHCRPGVLRQVWPQTRGGHVLRRRRA